MTVSTTNEDLLGNGLPEEYAEAIFALIADDEVADAKVVTGVGGQIITALIPTARCCILIERTHGGGGPDLDVRFVPWTAITSIRALKTIVHVSTGQGLATALYLDTDAAALSLAARLAAYLPA